MKKIVVEFQSHYISLEAIILARLNNSNTTRQNVYNLQSSCRKAALHGTEGEYFNCRTIKFGADDRWRANCESKWHFKAIVYVCHRTHRHTHTQSKHEIRAKNGTCKTKLLPAPNAKHQRQHYKTDNKILRDTYIFANVSYAQIDWYLSAFGGHFHTHMTWSN